VPLGGYRGLHTVYKYTHWLQSAEVRLNLVDAIKIVRNLHNVNSSHTIRPLSNADNRLQHS